MENLMLEIARLQGEIRVGHHGNIIPLPWSPANLPHLRLNQSRPI